MRLKTIKLVATVAIIAVLLLPGIAKAYIYEAPFAVQETSSTAYDMLPVFTTSQNQWLVDNGFIRSDARDTSVETLAGSVQPRMITEDKTFTAIPVPADSQTNLRFKTGQSNTNMDIIVGHNGYITVTDVAALEPGSDFEFEIDAYVDTDAGASKYLIFKDEAFYSEISAATDIKAAIVLGGWTTPTGHVANGWLTPALAWDDNTATVATFGVAGPAWTNFLELTHAAIDISEVRYYVSVNLPAIDKIDVDIFDGGWQDVYEGAFAQNVWEERSAIYTGVTAMRIRMYNSAGPVAVGQIHEADFYDSEEQEATATGVTSGEYTVTARTDALVWATDDVLEFDGNIDGLINAGAIHNASAKLWISMWFRRDVAATNYLFGKAIVLGVDHLIAYMDVAGSINFYKYVGGVQAFAINTAPTTYPDGDWHHAIFSISNVNGVRLRIDNGAAITDVDISAAPNGGDFVIGHRDDPGVGVGTTGLFANVIVGTDDLTPAEETALYNGTAPGDEVNLWYIDEGTGTTILDYGPGANNGTADTGTSWATSTRPCKFSISIDGTPEGGHARPVSVTDTANDWILNQNDVMPYMASYEQSVGGVLISHYEPITYIVGTTLPDRQGAAQNGVITWGANPAGVTVTLGSMVSEGQPEIGQLPETPSRDLLPEVEVSDWYVEPDVTGSLLTNPIRPFVTMISDNTTLTELQTWRWLGIAFVLLVTGACIYRIPRHLVIACIGAGVATVVMVVLTIFPQWTLVFLVLYALGGWVSERSPSL